MPHRLYSIRMRAESGSRHVSGAERIVSYDDIDRTVQTLISRAKRKGCPPGQIVLTIDDLEHSPIRRVTALDLVTLNTPDVPAARATASRALRAAGVSPQAVKSSIRHLTSGAASSGGTMRGAMIMDAQTGERLESDRERGIRASRFDWCGEAGRKIQERLSDIGLTHFRTAEALALATKVAYAPGVVAELCWSDDPDYTTGYVASTFLGYIRIPNLKQIGDTEGGRAFFVDPGTLNLDGLTRYLEEEAVLITGIGACRPAMDPDAYLSR